MSACLLFSFLTLSMEESEHMFAMCVPSLFGSSQKFNCQLENKRRVFVTNIVRSDCPPHVRPSFWEVRYTRPILLRLLSHRAYRTQLPCLSGLRERTRAWKNHLSRKREHRVPPLPLIRIFEVHIDMQDTQIHSL